MSFLYPQFLWALLALFIPVIIHLLNLRSYITVYFSNLNFLSDIQQETKSRLTLKRLILLLIRLLILASLILAFAFPVKKSTIGLSKQITNKVLICVDNSMSMSANRDAVRILDFAKTSAKNIALSYPKNSEYYLLSYNKSVFSRKLSQQQILAEIDNIGLWAKSSKLSNLLERSIAVQQSDSIAEFQTYLISDFQRSNTDFENLPQLENQNLNFLSIEPDYYKNVAIDSVWTQSPSHVYMHEEQLHVRLRNYGNEIVQNLQVNLSINDSSKAYSVVSINPNTTKTISFNYWNDKKGAILGQIDIDDYSLNFDNTFYFSYFIRAKTKIALLNNANEQWLNSFYSDTSFYTLKEFNSISEIENQNFDLLVLNQIEELSFESQEMLLNYLKNGANILFIPALNNTSGIYNSFFREIGASAINGIDTNEQFVDFIDYEHPVFKSAIKKQNKYLSLPKVKTYFKFNQQLVAEKYLLSFVNHLPALKEISYGAAKVYVFSFPLSKTNTNFVENPIIIPILFNIAFLNRSSDYLYYTIGNMLTLSLPIPFLEGTEINSISISKKNSSMNFIPRTFASFDNKLSLSVYNQLKDVSNYLVLQNEKPIYALSFNHQKSESENLYFTNQELEENIKLYGLNNISLFESDKIISAPINNINRADTSYWFYFVLLALIFLVGETMVMKLWK